QPLAVWQMNNERIETWTSFRFENLRDGDRVQCVSREPVNCFGRQRDHFTTSQKRDRLRVIRRRDDLRLHFGTRAASTDSVCFFRNDSRAFRMLLSESAMMPAARSAVFFAPAAPIARVPTGTPHAIWAVDGSEPSHLFCVDGIGI